MKVAIVKSSDLAREGRWDAGFHIALHEVRDRVDALKAILTAEEAIEKLEGVALADKAPLLVLARGNKALNSENMQRIVREYPHLSLALMEQNLEPAIARIRERLATDAQQLEHLLDLQAGRPEQRS
jgi:hypothetical protein